MSDDTWVRLKKGNDWGQIYLAENPKTALGFCDRALGIVTTEGEPVDVRFPDGSIVAASICYEPMTVEVGDMGHSSNVQSMVPVATYMDRGARVSVELTAVDVKKEWVTAHTRLKEGNGNG